MSKKNPITPWGKNKAEQARRERNRKVAIGGSITGGGVIVSAVISLIANHKIRKMQAQTIGNINKVGCPVTDQEVKK